MGRTAILAGGLAQAIVFVAFLTVVRPPQSVYLMSPAVAGIVAAVVSDRLSTYRDTGGAGLVGTLLSLGAFVFTAWWNASELPPEFRIDTAFIISAYGTLFLIFLLPLTVIISVVVGRGTTVIQNTRIVR